MLIAAIRNKFFDWGFFSSYEIKYKSICVGNLSTGGTGKTPHVDLIVSGLLDNHKNISILSRGYGRKTKGFREVKSDSTTDEVGDEPLFYKNKFNDRLNVFVSEKRVIGIKHIEQNLAPDTIIVLDDAFQHRAVKAGFSIIISEFSNLFTNDAVLPAGNLRESISSIKRADLIIISKCPNNITEKEKKEIRSTIRFNKDKILFSRIKYSELTPIFQPIDTEEIENVLLVTGIGNPKPLEKHLKKHYNVSLVKYPDHHDYNEGDIAKIHEKFDTFASRNKIIITTEKDFMRLKKLNLTNLRKYPWYIQPIVTEIDEQQKFNLYLNEYLSKI